MTDPGRPAGWYADPQGHAELRWWDGARWTEQTHPPAGSPAAFRGPGGVTSRRGPGHVAYRITSSVVALVVVVLWFLRC